MNDNICNYVPFHKDYNSIHTINFVYETMQKKYDELKAEAIYKMYYVCGGEGVLHTQGTKNKLSKGDVFFTFPAAPFCIESKENFTYMYISFLGTKASVISDRMGISHKNCVFHSCECVYDFWKNAFSYDISLCDIICESVLLYTYTVIGNKFIEDKNNTVKAVNAVSKIKKYIDDNLSDSTLSLKKISNELFYSQKYISAVFKKNIKLGFSDYLNTIRIQYACTMIQQGYTSVKDIARMCGYSDSHYFSNVFKKKMFMSPKAYINMHL